MAAPATLAPPSTGFGFALTEEQEAVRAMVRDFARSEIAPHVKEWDEAQIFPRDVIAKLGALGMLGVLVPEEYGGAGLSYIDYIHVVDELSRVDGSVGLSVAAHNSLCTNHLFLYGSEAQRRTWVTPLAQGKLLGAWGLTEAEAGSDSGGTKTTAVLDGDSWVLNGSKNFITHGSVGDVAVLMAVTDKAAGRRGISAFVVDLHQKGIHAGKKENKLGMRASDTATLVMEDCRIPRENLLGAPGEGFVQAMKVLDGGRISIAALALGMAEGAFEGARALRAGAQAVRQGDLRVPDDPELPRGHGDGDRRGAPPDVPRRLAEGPGRADDEGVRDGEALRLRGLRPRVESRGPDPRRLRLHEGLRRREVLPGLEALHDRRRNVRDPAPRDRARGPAEGRAAARPTSRRARRPRSKHRDGEGRGERRTGVGMVSPSFPLGRGRLRRQSFAKRTRQSR